MSFFTTDHGEAKNMFDPVKPGKYEAVITSAEVVPSKSSDSMLIKVMYTIRSDVDQPEQKRKVFDNYVQSPKAMFKFQQAAKAVGLPQGAQVATLDDFAKLIMFKAVKITVTNKKETYNGNEQIKDNVSFIDEPTVPYSGGNGPTTDPFAIGAATEFPVGDYGSDDESDIPPWERESVDLDADVAARAADQAAAAPAEKPKRGGKKKDQDPFADDGKPMDISDDDLPF